MTVYIYIIIAGTRYVQEVITLTFSLQAEGQANRICERYVGGGYLQQILN